MIRNKLSKLIQNKFSSGIKLNIDYFSVIPEKGYFIYGWIIDSKKEIDSIYLKSDNVYSDDIQRDFIKIDRPDVNNTYFKEVNASDHLGFYIILPFDRFVNSINLKNPGLLIKSKTGKEIERNLTLKSPPEGFIDTLSTKQSRNEGVEDLINLKSFVRFGIDSFISVSEHYVYLSGWLLDTHSTIKSIIIKNDKYESEDIRKQSHFIKRNDINDAFKADIIDPTVNAGFYSYIKLANKGSKQDYYIEIKTKEGEVKKIKLPQISVFVNAVELSKNLLQFIDVSQTDLVSRLNIICSAIKQKDKDSRVGIDKSKIIVKSFGECNPTPEVSVIIPLYGRFDFMSYQLALFANDEYIKKQEIIYVVDDPRIYDIVIQLGMNLYPIFRIPIKIVYAQGNYGYAGANNIGASQANGNYLLLLNSDVVPSKSFWLERFVNEFSYLETPGALGCTLLYEDDSIQHAGILFEKHPNIPEFWINSHPFKGLHKDIIQQTSTFEYPAVTGACLFLERSLYNEVGGLDENYLLGDFEDSDLCLKLLRKGKKNYVLPQIQLYHLERQSQNLFSDLSWKAKLTLYNCWQHTNIWSNDISEIMNKHNG